MEGRPTSRARADSKEKVDLHICLVSKWWSGRRRLANDVRFIHPRSLSRGFVQNHLFKLLISLEKWQFDTGISSIEENSSRTRSFLRVRVTSICRDDLLINVRHEIRSQLDIRKVPPSYVFLRKVGGSLIWVSQKQESLLRVKDFMPPTTPNPEIFIQETDACEDLEVACLQKSSEIPSLPPLFVPYDFSKPNVPANPNSSNYRIWTSQVNVPCTHQLGSASMRPVSDLSEMERCLPVVDQRPHKGHLGLDINLEEASLNQNPPWHQSRVKPHIEQLCGCSNKPHLLQECEYSYVPPHSMQQHPQCLERLKMPCVQPQLMWNGSNQVDPSVNVDIAYHHFPQSNPLNGVNFYGSCTGERKDWEKHEDEVEENDGNGKKGDEREYPLLIPIMMQSKMDANNPEVQRNIDFPHALSGDRRSKCDESGVRSYGGHVSQLTINPLPPPAHDNYYNSLTRGELPISRLCTTVNEHGEGEQPQHFHQQQQHKQHQQQENQQQQCKQHQYQEQQQQQHKQHQHQEQQQQQHKQHQHQEQQQQQHKQHQHQEQQQQQHKHQEQQQHKQYQHQEQQQCKQHQHHQEQQQQQHKHQEQQQHKHQEQQQQQHKQQLNQLQKHFHKEKHQHQNLQQQQQQQGLIGCEDMMEKFSLDNTRQSSIKCVGQRTESQGDSNAIAPDDLVGSKGPDYCGNMNSYNTRVKEMECLKRNEIAGHDIEVGKSEIEHIVTNNSELGTEDLELGCPIGDTMKDDLAKQKNNATGTVADEAIKPPNEKSEKNGNIPTRKHCSDLITEAKEVVEKETERTEPNSNSLSSDKKEVPKNKGAAEVSETVAMVKEVKKEVPKNKGAARVSQALVIVKEVKEIPSQELEGLLITQTSIKENTNTITAVEPERVMDAKDFNDVQLESNEILKQCSRGQNSNKGNMYVAPAPINEIGVVKHLNDEMLLPHHHQLQTSPSLGQKGNELASFLMDIKKECDVLKIKNDQIDTLLETAGMFSNAQKQNEKQNWKKKFSVEKFRTFELDKSLTKISEDIRKSQAFVDKKEMAKRRTVGGQRSAPSDTSSMKICIKKQKAIVHSKRADVNCIKLKLEQERKAYDEVAREVKNLKKKLSERKRRRAKKAAEKRKSMFRRK